MIYKTGNLFDHVSSGVILHGANAQGVMGSGFAKEFRAKYPLAYDIYRHDILTDKTKLGDVSWCYLYANGGLSLASGITQEFYGKDGKKYASYDAIESVVDNAITEVKFLVSVFQDDVLHMPKIGCGLGGLQWEVVEKIIEVTAKKRDFDTKRIIVWEL